MSKRIQTVTNWAPNYFDMYGGPTHVEDAVAAKAAYRINFQPIELGNDAGRAVLDQYAFAKGEQSMAGTAVSILSFQNIANITAVGLPVAGIVAALGVDYQIFHVASDDIKKSDLPFNAFAVGSLIFAGALGMSERQRNHVKSGILYLALAAASVGAALITANNNNLRKNFTDSVTSAFPAGSDDAQKVASALQINISSLQAEIDKLDKQLLTGGNNGRPMLDDGNKHNDDQAHRIEDDIRTLRKEKQEKQADYAAAEPALTIAKRLDWADLQVE